MEVEDLSRISWSVMGGREGQVSSLGPVGLEVLASRHTSHEDGARQEQRWTHWQATLAKARAAMGQRRPRAVAALAMLTRNRAARGTW